jgi:uncharacterized protein YjbI with pentapeptide repeats
MIPIGSVPKESCLPPVRNAVLPYTMAQSFSGQNLQGRSFRGQDLTGVDFSYADIRGTDFSRAILVNADFSHAIAGLQRRWVMLLLTILFCVGVLAIFIAGVVATFAGTILVSENEFRGIDLMGLMNPIILAVFFSLTLHKGWITAQVSIAFLAVFGAIILLLQGHPAGAVVVASDILWMIVLAIAGIATFASTLAVTNNNPWIITGAGLIAWMVAVLVVHLVTPRLTETEVVAVFRGVAIASAAGVLLSLYVSYQAIGGTPKFASLQRWIFAFAALGGTRFRGANLTDTKFTHAILQQTDLRGAILTRTCWLNAKNLERTRHEGSYLEDLQIRRLMITRFGQAENLNGKNLQGTNLQNANLVEASLIGANLNEVNLIGADLSRAKLVQTQLYGANLTFARLTGAYIQNWGISPDTQLHEVDCQYVYLHLPTSEDPDPYRKPDNRSEVFKQGDFADFIAPIIKTLGLYYQQNVDPRAITTALKTLDLYHDEAIDPGAATVALKQLAEKYPEAALEIVSVEGHGQDKVRLQATVTNEADRSELSAEYFTTYREIKSLPSRDVQALLTGIAEKDQRIHSLEQMVITALSSQRFYAETYYNLGETMSDHRGNIQISDVQGNVSGIAAAGQDQTMMGVAIGQISGEVTTSIQQLQESNPLDTAPLVDLLQQLQRMIEMEGALTSEDKAEALEQVKALAEAGQKPTEGAMKRVANTAIKILKGTVASLPSAAELVEACNKLLPLIAKLLYLA